VRNRVLLFIAATLCAGIMPVLAANASAATSYTPAAPVVDAVTGGPWNSSQGDSSAGTSYPGADLLPSYIPGGSFTELGGVQEPNLAVYSAAEATKVPYPSGVAGTPGPLDGYCASLGANPETGGPVPQPGRALPMAPYYFPYVVRNADGSLTGYFDYRPKDAEESIVVAKSTDGGQTWTTEGVALGENSGYCPTADTNDDGQGHPYVTNVGSSTDLYTLQRPAGDNTGIGLLVHGVHPAAGDPLEGSPADQPVGVDPNTFASAEETVPDSAEGGSATIPVSTLGEAGSPEHIVAGPYEDYNAASPSSTVITCTGTSTAPVALTGCTVAGSNPLKVHAQDDLVQVIAKAEAGVTVPKGPNNPSGEGGLAELKFTNGNASVSPLTTYIMNLNAPNRVYIDGQAVYCTQANANPTTKLEDCTGGGAAEVSVHAGDAITADPIVPPGAQMTSGLKAPDGIVGTLPSYPGAPAGSTVVLYTEKILSYFIEGTTNGFIEGTKFEKKTIKLPKATINFTPSVTESQQPLPESGSFKIYLGTAVGQPIQEVTCTGDVAATQAGVPAGSRNLTGCTGGTGEVKEGNWVGGPNSAITPYTALEQTGEGTNGKSKGPEKLFGNNEDLTVLRAAYTTDGVNFHDLGAISGSTSGTGNNSGSYNDVTNPDQQSSPKSTSEPTVATPTPAGPTSLSGGSSDQIELRYVGSRGTIVTNPNGTYGMFLSGAWSSDGDSDAFNQIFYTESSNGKEWSVPKVVLGTEYEFKASREQDEALAGGIDSPLGISAYYSGRAYGPAVVQNPNGTLTMVFSGYRLPKPVASAGTKLGTNASAQYTVSEKDPALYRNILTMHLASSTSPAVGTTTTVSASDEGTGSVGAAVTYTATVTPSGSGTPTGTVAFADAHGAIAGCSEAKLSELAPDTATCSTTHAAPAGSDEVTATYSGDSNYAGSSGHTSENVQEGPAITSAGEATFTEGSEGSFEVTATGTPKPTLSETGSLPEGVSFDSSTGKLSGKPTQEGTFAITFHAANGAGPEAVQHFTLTVDAPPAFTSADETTLTEGSEGSFEVTATGTPAPSISETGTLPEGVQFDAATHTIAGTPTQSGSFTVALEASNGVGANAIQQLTIKVDAAPSFSSPGETAFTEGAFGTFTVTAGGTPSPAISEQGALPEGVSFEPFGDTLSGVPTQEGVFHIRFTAANGVAPDAVQDFTLAVDAPARITSAPEATFDDHVASEFAVTATGTPSPTITKWGTLPEGVTFAGGVLSGTPTQTGTFEITFTAENDVGQPSTQRFTLTVHGLHITTSSLPPVTPGTPYSQQLQASGGIQPFKWKRASGKLPAGLKLSGSGLLSGTVSARKYPHGGSFPVTVQVKDAAKKNHQTATAAFTISVS
jgi:hypothetical protein